MHYKFAIQALLRNKDVFVEKPMALNFSHAEEMIDLAKKQKCILMVGYLLQYHPVFIKLKELANNGELGRLEVRV